MSGLSNLGALGVAQRAPSGSHERLIMNDTHMTLDQILTIGGLGSGPYGGGDVVR